MENVVKKTKNEYFKELLEIVTSTVEDETQKSDFIDFIENQIAALEKRKMAAAKRAAKKREESDSLTEEIFGLIGEDLVTVDEVVVALDNAEITRNKVIARLGNLVRMGRIVKENVKVEGKRKVAYRLASDEDVVEETVETEDVD